MVKKDNQADDAEEPFVLKWKWRPEHHFEHIKKKGFVDGSVMTIEQLLDQKTVTNDTSDYLWYYSRYSVCLWPFASHLKNNNQLINS